jgi:hypothetical protein
MYDRLHAYMNTDIFGYTAPSNYGPGFVEMALHYGYDNFSYVPYGYAPYDPVTRNTYWDIVNAIDNGWPVALEACFKGVNAISNVGALYPSNWPPGGFFCGHYIVIRGYEWEKVVNYRGTDYLYRRIICTDNCCEGDNLVLDWDQLVYVVGANPLVVIIIKDG